MVFWNIRNLLLRRKSVWLIQLIVKKFSFFVVDFFNDLTGMSKMADKLWDLQSKGDKQPSPYIIGTELVT